MATDYLKGPGLNAPFLNWNVIHDFDGSQEHDKISGLDDDDHKQYIRDIVFDGSFEQWSGGVPVNFTRKP